MRALGCSIKKITTVLIRPGAMVQVHDGPPFQAQEAITQIDITLFNTKEFLGITAENLLFLFLRYIQAFNVFYSI